ncbi:MAG: hypothetical protein ACREBK_07905, partial [Sphingomicrobium sp.]
QIYSPGAIAKDLEKRGYRIEKMKRKGTTYSITATGPNKNRVQMTVDGRSGDVVGLAVLQAAANLAGAIAAIVTSGKGNRYVDDWHPFGIIIPDTYQTRWTVIPTWNVYTTQYVTESWSGAGYRFAVPYASIRPGYNGMSVTTFAASDFGSPIYEVYDFNGTEISTDYSESSYEISATESFETSYETQNEQLEESYLGGAVDDDEVELGDVADYDSEDGDFSIADDADDDYDADFDDSGDDDDQDVDDDADEDDQDVDDDDQDFDDEQDVDEPDDDGDYDDGGDDYDDGGDEPELSSVR